jgi:hypothetical protein
MTNAEIQQRLDEIYATRRKLDEEVKRLESGEGKNRYGEKYPAGSIVTDKRGKKYIVHAYGVYGVKGKPIRKDGTPSDVLQTIWGLE